MSKGKTHWAECWIDHDECLVDGLRSAAQNDYMIDQNYLPTGSLLLMAADRIAELEAERDQLSAALRLIRAHFDMGEPEQAEQVVSQYVEALK
jgi:hypothetical protein